MRFRWLGLILAGASIGFAQSTTVVVRPKPIPDILRNPGMGIQTFQRFEGQALNPESKWSEVGPEAPLPDVNNVDFPPSSVAYLRWYWSQLEPKQGEYRWEIIDSALAEAHRHGQKLAVRVMPYDPKSPMPAWYIASSARRANKTGDADGAIWSPDSDDPLYIASWSKLVRLLGKRYDGHPDLDTVDISTFGYWGEGWGPYPPSEETQTALIDVHFSSFQKTKLLMNFDVQEMLIYGTQRGAGWRADCWGDEGRPGKGMAHMVDMYPRHIASPSVREAWQNAPVSLEVCGTVSMWQKWRFSIQPILDTALRWHASTINLKSSPIPPEWKPAFDEFQRKLGYRYSLRRIEYPESIQRSRPFTFKTLWLNAGVAPVYDDYAVALEWSGNGQRTVVRLPINLREWVPGDWVYECAMLPPDGLAPGDYTLRIAVIHPETELPAILLANEGREPDGWYRIGQLRIDP